MTPAPETPAVVHIDNRELGELLGEGASLVDIRAAPEWAETGIVKGSHLLTFFDPRGGHDAAGWLEEVQKLAAGDRPVILICRSGTRTVPVSHFLAQAGIYPAVYNVRAGILGWIGAGLPVDRLAPKDRETP